MYGFRVRGRDDSGAWREVAMPVSEDVAILIVVAMLTSMTLVISGAASIAARAIAALI
jgi:hypothetical protein